MQRSELVNAYLQVLNLADDEPDFNFLSEMVRRHVATFTFSSVGCRLGEALPLDFEALFDRIVVRRRGGYCFEHNGLFYEVLDELGFSPELYLGRVIYNQATHPGLTHRISMIAHEGQRYVVDVGFGPLGPRVPVLLSEEESSDGQRVFRVKEQIPGELHLQVFKDGDFFSLYRFELARYGQADCELGHFYSHRHPKAVFVNNLVASRLLENETRSLRNLGYQIITTSGTQTYPIDSPEQLTQLLVEELDLQVTEAEGKRLFDDFGP